MSTHDNQEIVYELSLNQITEIALASMPKVMDKVIPLANYLHSAELLEKLAEEVQRFSVSGVSAEYKMGFEKAVSCVAVQLIKTAGRLRAEASKLG